MYWIYVIAIFLYGSEGLTIFSPMNKSFETTNILQMDDGNTMSEHACNEEDLEKVDTNKHQKNKFIGHITWKECLGNLILHVQIESEGNI